MDVATSLVYVLQALTRRRRWVDANPVLSLVTDSSTTPPHHRKHGHTLDKGNMPSTTHMSPD
jgi:hypothetical protein